ncbi:phosphate/phosphite/phosphonate ABC transporter substrate-binding protein [Taklimakanibacter deserti]|uniref:phosphate/phosphite/phosphonate ABC transporter substrate-binding protein n=1 Tax=Taklimakanibacter deserti TaxID=2267839 RepID=UPI000E64F056
MIVSLPMYDWPEIGEATDAFAQGVLRHLGGESPRLDRNPDYFALWRRPDLVFSQTCGYPFTHEFRGRLSYVATPHYAAPGCAGAQYSSFVFARERRPLAQFRASRAAVNNPDSMSGMLALKLVFARHAENGRFFSHVVETGGHVGSMIAVRDGKADICAIDSVCVALARRYRPDYLEGLVEIARSPMVPGLPFVTAAGRDPVRLRLALARAFADPELAPAREALFLDRHSILAEGAYDLILELERQMEKAGGLKLS